MKNYAPPNHVAEMDILFSIECFVDRRNIVRVCVSLCILFLHYNKMKPRVGIILVAVVMKMYKDVETDYFNSEWFVQVFDGNDNSATELKSYNGSNTVPTTAFTSTSSVVFVEFKTGRAQSTGFFKMTFDLGKTIQFSRIYK